MKRVAVAATLLTLLAFAPSASAKVNNPFLTAYASCGNSKPFKPGKRCNYDGSTKFRGTYFFKSKVGPIDVKTCFRIYGPKPLGGRNDCGNLYSVTQRALPFRATGVRQAFKVKFTLFTKGAGSTAPFNKTDTSFLRVRP